MASRSIRVAVLEEDFATLSVAGFPLSLSMLLQISWLKLCDALWIDCQILNITFFWPSVSSKPAIDTEKKQKRRARQRPRKQLSVGIWMQKIHPILPDL